MKTFNISKRNIPKNIFSLSPVVSTILVLGIVTSVIAATLLWGIPFIEERERDTQLQNSKNGFINLEGSIGSLLQLPRDSSSIRTSYIKNSREQGSISVDESGTRMVVWYSLNSTRLNFTVDGLEDNDDSFTVDVDRGTLKNVSVYWFNDTCFKEGTQVLMDDGSYKKIENIDKGDKVECSDGDGEVEYVHQYTASQIPYDKYIDIDEKLSVTPNHQFLTINGWVAAKNLEEGSLLKKNSSGYYEIIDIGEESFSGNDWYDLSVSGSNYYVRMGDLDVSVRVSDFSLDDVPSSDIKLDNTSSWEKNILSGSYTVSLGRNIKGSVQIDLFSDKLRDPDYDGKLNPVGKIFVFDLGDITHRLPYSDGTYNMVYENGAVFSIDNRNNSHLINEPEFFENKDENTIGVRVIQIRHGNRGTGGSGIASYKLRTWQKIYSNNLLEYETENVYNLSIKFHGEHAEQWREFFEKIYDFNKKNDFLRYNEEKITLVFFMSIIKADVFMEH
ncbi:MAG: Hint domain-containing protein [Candidatus Thermoplasmatota archaeon]